MTCSVEILSGVKNIFHGYKEVKIYNKSDYFKKSILNGTKDNAKFQIRFKTLLKVLLSKILKMIWCYFIIQQLWH